MRKAKSAGNSLVSAVVVILIMGSFFLCSCTRLNKNSVSGKDAGTGETRDFVEIKEKMFIAQVNDVYLNPKDYLGKTIKLEGLFKQDHSYEKTYSFVIRYGPGCCGNDGNAGFEVAWAAEKAKPYPAEDSWVEATGVLKTYEENGYSDYLYLDLSSLNVLSRRGAETVMQ
jgi:uncharacterized membrane protein YcgQ (UPF0703/DUF1980 family)